jgi:hypothetical protein
MRLARSERGTGGREPEASVPRYGGDELPPYVWRPFFASFGSNFGFSGCRR